MVKAKQGESQYASPGNGTLAHLLSEMLTSMADIKIRRILGVSARTDRCAGTRPDDILELPARHVSNQGRPPQGAGVKRIEGSTAATRYQDGRKESPQLALTAADRVHNVDCHFPLSLSKSSAAQLVRVSS